MDTTSYKGASDWAIAELDRAAGYGLITSRIQNNMSSNITREEFAEVALKLYEIFTGKNAPDGNVKFNDTTNPNIIKAASLGLVSGIGNNKFAPKDLITREQMATILLRVLKVIQPEWDFSTGNAVFYDDNKVESWAREGVYYCYQAGLVKGVGKTNGMDRFDPDGNATREMAVIICSRAFEKTKGSGVYEKNEPSGAGNSSGSIKADLPDFIPEDIPFTEDAVLESVEDNSHAMAWNQNMTIVYSTKSSVEEVASIYRKFTGNHAVNNSESMWDGTYFFASTFTQYRVDIIIQKWSKDKTQVTLTLNPTEDAFAKHYQITDYSVGAPDNSGVAYSEKLNPNQLMAGSRGTDPYRTNLFVSKKDGTLWAYGYELYIGAEEDAYRWNPITITDKWIKIDENAWCLDTDTNNYFVLKPDKSLWTYGDNYSHLLGNGEAVITKDYPPTKVLDNVRTADIGKNGIAVKNDNSLWIWGESSAVFSVMDNPEEDRLEPVKVMDGVVDAVQSGDPGWDMGGLIMVLKADGSLWTWGEGNCGDGGVTKARKDPIKIMNGVKYIEASNSLCCVIKSDNSLWVWESHVTAIEGPNEKLVRPTRILEDVKSVSPGERFLVALKNDGSVWTFGDNTDGQCGTGSLSPDYLEKPVKILDGAVEVIATDYNAFALMANGTILGWGLNVNDWLPVKEWKILKPSDIGFGVK